MKDEKDRLFLGIALCALVLIALAFLCDPPTAPEPAAIANEARP